jgi:hypothetical protein
MRRVALVVLALAFTFGAAAQAGARGDAVLVIRPAQSIGKIRLGMTETQLRRAMGRPRAVVPRTGSFGLRTVEYEYGYAAYVVRLFGPRDRLRVTSVATTLRRERTSKGIGRGSLERDVARAYPAARCAQLKTWRSRGGAVTYVISARRTCTLFAPNGRRTTFTSAPPSGPFLSPARWRETARVVEVAVADR